MEKNKSLKILIFVLLLGGLIYVLVHQGYILKEYSKPKPIVVSSKFDDSSSKFMEYSGKLVVEVRNEGGKGGIILEAEVQQGEESWKKTQNLYVNSNDTVTYEVIFDEVKMMGAKPKVNFNVFAQ
ncbi:MAG TPA: hypothetical protein PLV82_04645 [bacterium]|jgi:hypothetical protein|nr:hypothetical protein [bacterium]